MRVPFSWLKEYVALPADPAVLVERLTLAGLEAASVEVLGIPVPQGLRVKPEDAGLVWERDQVLVAKVLEIAKHPDADKLKLVKVDYGAAEPKTVVTGATNIEPGQSGMKVILGLRGTRYFYTDKDGSKKVFTLEPKALRGIMNDAMCMSNFELGISEEHAGIILLDDDDPAPGTPAQDLFGDVIVDLDVLPNMARCLSLLGIAREVSALTGAMVCEPDLAVPTAKESIAGQVQVQIENPALCARYSAMLIRGVKIGPSPRWMQTRLTAAGMRPISNIVDITNYVMLEYGQPLHAFDYDVLVKRAGGKAPTIIVRPAKPGERLTTLDGQVRELGPDNLIIADTQGPIALAGVMGGAETEVTDATTNILLESASFDPVAVRKTARQFTLFSEASTRFSKGVHPEVVTLAARRTAQLFHKHAGGTVLDGMVDEYPAPLAPQVIELNRSEIGRVLGFDLPDDEVERILKALQFEVAPTVWGWKVTTPTTRLDIQCGAADLIEELARVSGYDHLPETLLAQGMPVPRGNRSLALEDRVKDLLADAGLQEVLTYALTSADREARLHPQGDAGTPEYVTLQNPISPERAVLRQTLLPHVLEVARDNLAIAESVALFELNFVYIPRAGGELPDEPRQLAIVLSGRRTPAAWDDPQGAKPAQYDFYDLKGVLGTLTADLHLPKVAYRAIATVPYLHPGRAAELLVNDQPVGMLGELHPLVGEAFDLAERTVLVAVLDVERLLAAVPDRYGYRPIPEMPPAKRDVAVIVPADLPAAQVLEEMQAAGGGLLTEATLFDVYTGESIPAGTKSLAFALTYQASDRTLTDKEIDKAHQKIEGRLRHVLKAQIRGKD